MVGRWTAWTGGGSNASNRSDTKNGSMVLENTNTSVNIKMQSEAFEAISGMRTTAAADYRGGKRIKGVKGQGHKQIYSSSRHRYTELMKAELFSHSVNEENS